MKHTTVKQWLYYARDLLMETEDRHEAEFQAKCMLSHVLKCKLTQLSFCAEEILGEDQLLQLKDLLAHRLKGEPLQYLLGSWEFMGLEFLVAPGVLIPRQDTETIVEYALQLHKKRRFHSVLDLCCGSGCIGISLGYYLKDSKVKGFDISSLALDTARRNAERNRVSGRVEFFQIDLMNDSILEDFDCVVSNPPYIPSYIINSLDAKVKNFEPLSALDGGKSGLEFYERISAVAPVKKGGIIAFEIGYDQGKEVAEILDKNGYKDIEIIKDLENRDRVVTGISTKVRTADRS